MFLFSIQTAARRCLYWMTLSMLCFGLFLGFCQSGQAWEDEDHPTLRYAESLFEEADLSRRITWKVDSTLGCTEAFEIQSDDRRLKITGGGPSGVLYGVQESIRCLKKDPEAELDIKQSPDFKLRGAVQLLMKDCSYDWALTPEEFPWFFDRALLTRYFDYLFENRFNMIFLWSGHIFPSLVELPEYPDAADLSREQVLQNQEQFKWFTNECAKRNISVLVHFYNIHYTKSLAEAHDFKLHTVPSAKYAATKPTEFLADYYRYTLERFLREFKSVGLYLCPGEALLPEYQPEWIRDVIIAAAKAAGTHPTIVVRAWGMDELKFKKFCAGQYDKLYTEGKHNIEKLVSPVPDPRHRQWKELTGKHVVNVHETSDIKPLRWGSPKFIHEMVSEWKKAGIDGAEIFGQVSWRWPYTLDKLEPDQETFWPEGPKLLTFERDWIWQAAFGRYMWQVERDPQKEEDYWTARLAERFGTQKAGDLIRRWYETTGPILPGLQNMVDVECYNGYPTTSGYIPIRDILRRRTYRQQGWPVPHPYRPVDRVFYDRYRKKFDVFHPDPVGMTVREYVDALAAGDPTFSVIGRQNIQAILAQQIVPPQVLELMFEMIDEAEQMALRAREAATKNRDEIDRFINDTGILRMITQSYHHKVMAAISLFLYEKKGKEEDRQAVLEHLAEALRITRELVERTDRTYINTTDLSMGETHNWHGALKILERDFEKYTDMLSP